MRARHCFHVQVDPRCMATTEHEHENPLHVVGIGPAKHVHADQAKVGVCCRCEGRMPMIPFVFLSRVWALFAFCPANPEAAAADALASGRPPVVEDPLARDLH